MGSKNLRTENSKISYQERVSRNQHKAGVLWFSGLSGSGKSTIAQLVEQKLFVSGKQVYILDGDNVRQGLSKDLGFSDAERSENMRRVSEVAKLFADAGFIVICAFISPQREDRLMVRDILGDLVHNIYIKASVDTCKARDPKGLYQKAIAGKIKNFTGIDADYEIPSQADLIINTEQQKPGESAASLFDYIEKNIL